MALVIDHFNNCITLGIPCEAFHRPFETQLPSPKHKPYQGRHSAKCLNAQAISVRSRRSSCPEVTLSRVSQLFPLLHMYHLERSRGLIISHRRVKYIAVRHVS